ASERFSRTCVVQSTRSFEVSRRVQSAGVKRERGAASPEGSSANASAAPATVSACGRIHPATAGASLREGDTPDPTSPETGPDRRWEMPRGAVPAVTPCRPHFLLQTSCRPAGTLAGEESLKSAIAAVLAALIAPQAFAQDNDQEVVETATRFPEQRL